MTRLSGERGSIVVSVIAIGVGISVLLFFSGGQVQKLLQKMKQKETRYSEMTALNSLLDYTYLGLKNSWCFRTDWLKEEDSKCKWSHPRNSARLTLSRNLMQRISKPITGGGVALVSPVALLRIGHAIRLAAIGENHPLSQVIGSLDRKKYLSIELSVLRAEGPLFTVVKNKVYLEVSIKLVPQPGSKESPLLLSSKIALSHRELNYFSLVVAGDLQLYSSSKESAHVSMIGSSSSKASGLVFESPVYIDRNIILPPSKHFNNITFSDQVVLGSGNPYRNGRLLYNRTAGGVGDRYLSDIPGISGILSGISLDPGADQGLSRLSKIVGARSQKEITVEKCSLDRLGQIDMSKSAESILVGKLESEMYYPDTEKYYASYDLALTETNSFTPQLAVPSEVKNLKGRFYVSPKITSEGISQGVVAVIGVNVRVGNRTLHTFESTMALGDTMSTKLKFLETKNYGKNVEELEKMSIKAGGDRNTRIKLATQQDRMRTLEQAVTDSHSNIQVINDELQRSSESDPLQIEFKRLEENLNRAKYDLEQDPANPALQSVKDRAERSLNSIKHQLNSTSAHMEASNKIRSLNNLIMQSSKEILKLKKDMDITLKSVKPDEAGSVDPEELKERLLFTKQLMKFTSLAEAKPPKLIVRLDPVKEQGVAAENKIRVHIWMESLSNFGPLLVDKFSKLANMEKVTVEIHIRALDRSTFGTTEMRSASSNKRDQSYIEGYERKGTLYFLIDGNEMKPKSFVKAKDWDSLNRNGAFRKNKKIVYANRIGSGVKNKKCFPKEVRPHIAFPDTARRASFTAQTRLAWNFSTDNSEVFRIDGKLAGSRNPKFIVRSISGRCLVKPSAQFLVGFLVCEEFEILPRKRPLRIVGTVIARKIKISREAVSAGISWASLRHPDVGVELQARGVLKASRGKKCIPKMVKAKWHPGQSEKEYLDNYLCRVESLRLKVKPFSWTQVDPACGVSNGQGSFRCNPVAKRFLLTEYSRKEGIL